MFNLSLEQATTEEQLRHFQEAFSNASRSHVSMDYLRGATVFFAKKSGVIIGGAVCNGKATFRYSEWWSDLATASILPHSVEFACLWASQAASKLDAAFMQVRLFYECHRQAKKLKRPFVIAGTLHPKLAATQSFALNIPIYDGPYAGDPSRWCCIYASHEEGFLKRVSKVFLKELWARLKVGNGSRRVSTSSFGRQG